MDKLTLMVLAQDQPRAKIRDANGNRILCAACVAYTAKKWVVVKYDNQLGDVVSPRYSLDNRSGPQGKCYRCGMPLQRPRLNPV